MLLLSTFEHMSTKLLRVRVDAVRAKKAVAILAAVGLKPTEAVNIFFARVVAHGGIPFPVVRDETDELLNDAAFIRHLGRMKRGVVKYRKLSP